MSAPTTTNEPHTLTGPLIDRRVSKGANRDDSAALLHQLLTDHDGDNLAAALVHQGFATEKQAHQFLTDRKRVWIHDGGMTACDTHAGHYLAAAITNHPHRKLHRTPRGIWERYDGDDIACETCAPLHIG